MDASRNNGMALIYGVLAVVLVVPLVFAPAYDNNQDLYGYGLRVTARVAFGYFLLAYIGRPLVQVFRTGRWLVRHRRYLGISAAIAHTVHFVYVVLYFIELGEAPDLITMVFGGLAFVMFWLMAITSNDASMRLLGPRWKQLHRFGMHYIWIIFAQSWLGALAVGHWTGVLGIVSLLALGLRIYAYTKTKRKRTAAA